MCGGERRHSVGPMTYTTQIRSLAGAVIAVLLLALAVAVASADAAGKTETLRIFSKVQTFTYTKADGTVVQGPPPASAAPGDSFEIDSLDYRGTHKQHSKKPIGADYLRCEFNGGPEPACMGYAALGNSLLRFRGMEVIGAIGRWKSGKILSNKDVDGDSDIVIRLVRR